MRRLTICSCICVCICITVLLLALIAHVLSLDQAQPEAQPKVLRVGFERTKPLNNLDALGSQSADKSNSQPISTQKPVHNLSMLSRIEPKVAFNASQRTGMVAKLTYDTGIFKPFYNVSANSNVKPIYDVPDSVHKKPVYNIGNYPKIMSVNSIP